MERVVKRLRPKEKSRLPRKDASQKAVVSCWANLLCARAAGFRRNDGSAFLTDAIIVQRYIEVERSLKRVLAVVKVRASAHSTEIRQFEITDEGIVVIGDPVLDYEGLLGGRPTRTPMSKTNNRGEP